MLFQGRENGTHSAGLSESDLHRVAVIAASLAVAPIILSFCLLMVIACVVRAHGLIELRRLCRNPFIHTGALCFAPTNLDLLRLLPWNDECRYDGLPTRRLLACVLAMAAVQDVPQLVLQFYVIVSTVQPRVSVPEDGRSLVLSFAFVSLAFTVASLYWRCARKLSLFLCGSLAARISIRRDSAASSDRDSKFSRSSSGRDSMRDSKRARTARWSNTQDLHPFWEESAAPVTVGRRGSSFGHGSSFDPMHEYDCSIRSDSTHSDCSSSWSRSREVSHSSLFSPQRSREISMSSFGRNRADSSRSASPYGRSQEASHSSFGRGRMSSLGTPLGRESDICEEVSRENSARSDISTASLGAGLGLSTPSREVASTSCSGINPDVSPNLCRSRNSSRESVYSVPWTPDLDYDHDAVGEIPVIEMSTAAVLAGVESAATEPSTPILRAAKLSLPTRPRASSAPSPNHSSPSTEVESAERPEPCCTRPRSSSESVVRSRQVHFPGIEDRLPSVLELEWQGSMLRL